MRIAKFPSFFVLLWTIVSASAAAQQIPPSQKNQLVFDSTTQTIGFRWLGDPVQIPFEPYAAMLIPIRLQNCPQDFYMQFDLGAPGSMFYSDKIWQIHEKYPAAITFKDTSTLADLRFQLGSLRVVAKEIKLIAHSKSPINWKDKNDVTIIGTIGADLIDGRVVVIDYPAKMLSIGNEVPAKLMSLLTITDMTFAYRRVLLPAQLRGKTTMMFFDTGSSAYELVTDRETAEALSSDTIVVRNEIRSWNRTLTANTLPSSGTIELAGVTLPLMHVTYMEGASSTQIAQMKRMGIGGMIGNKIFLNSVLMLDTRNQKFGLIRKRK
jgi:hypothetical protein